VLPAAVVSLLLHLQTPRFRGLAALAATAAMAMSVGPALADEAPVDGSTPVDTTPVDGTTPIETTPVDRTTPSATTPADAAPVASSTAEGGAAAPVPAQVPFAAASSDLFAPKVAIGKVGRQLEVARRHGLRVTYTVSERVHLRADVLIYGDVADRELRMSALPAAGPGDSLAKATISRTATGTNVVRLPFNVAARRTLRKFYKITVRVRLIATDAAGNESTSYKRLSLTLD
jgi:hypothetical protein